MYNFWLAQVFGVLGIIASVSSMQMKKKKHIMIMLLLLNISSGLCFLFLDSISGTLINAFAVLETIINYRYDLKEKKVPIYIIGIYVVVNLVLGIIAYKSLIDLFPIACSLMYCLTVCTKKESNIRKEMFINQILWLIYDVTVKAYMFSVSNVLTMISIIISMIRYDYKGRKVVNGKR